RRGAGSGGPLELAGPQPREPGGGLGEVLVTGAGGRWRDRTRRRRLAGMAGVRVGAQELHLGADPVQALQRLTHAGLIHVTGAVQEEDVPAQALAGRPRLDAGEV